MDMDMDMDRKFHIHGKPAEYSVHSYRQSLKTFLFSKHYCVQRIEAGFATKMLYTNPHLTLTLICGKMHVVSVAQLSSGLVHDLSH